MRENSRSSSSSLAPASSLEQMTLLKEGGVCVICGPSTGGLIWPNMTQDMLLRQVLKSERFQRAVVICIDRSAEEVKMSVRAGTGTGTGEPHHNLMRKLSCISAIGITTGVQTVEEIVQRVQDTIQEGKQQHALADEDEDETGTPQLTAVLVYSLSALHLALGGNAAVKFMSELNSILAGKERGQGQAQTVTKVPNQQARSLGMILGVVHSAQHSPRDIVACYRSRSDVFSTIIVNNGQLSSTVAIEVASIRVGASMKVTEGIDSLTLASGVGNSSGGSSNSNTANSKEWLSACLTPLPKRRDEDESRDTGRGHDHVHEHVKDDTVEQVESVFGKKMTFLGADSGGASTQDPASIAIAVEEANQANAAIIAKRTQNLKTQRLITFASTDPEFDEDSDPDGDLDL